MNQFVCLVNGEIVRQGAKMTSKMVNCRRQRIQTGIRSMPEQSLSQGELCFFGPEWFKEELRRIVQVEITVSCFELKGCKLCPTKLSGC